MNKIRCFAFFIFLSVCCMAQKESGLLISFGTGEVTHSSFQFNNPEVLDILEKGGDQDFYYKCNAALGYRFRLSEPRYNRFFYDVDMLIGIKWIRFNTFYGDGNALRHTSSSDLFCPVSIAASFNYKIIKGLYIGAGLAPTAILASKTMFDLPVIARVGYTINNKIEFAFNYQYGLLSAFKTDEYKGGHFSEWNVSVYIPFTLRGKK